MIVPIGTDYAGQTVLPAEQVKILKTVNCEQHTIVLRSDGRVAGWGEYWHWAFGPSDFASNTDAWYHQSSMPLGIGPVQDIATSSNFALLLMKDGSLIGWGAKCDGVFDLPEGAGDLGQIAAGESFAVGLDRAGKVYAWGDKRDCQCDVPERMGRVVSISAAGSYALALNSKGQAFGWGLIDDDVPPPKELRNIAAISVGYDHALALRRDGSVIAWGSNGWGQCEIPKDLKPCKAICAASFGSVAIERASSKAIAWGDDISKLPPWLPPLKSVSGGLGVFIGTTAKGKLVGWGSEDLRPAAYSIPVGILGLR